MSKIISGPMQNIELVVQNVTQTMVNIHRKNEQVRIGYDHPHIQLPQIRHIAVSSLSELQIPKYLQYSSHDTQVTNMWQFLGLRNWTSIPYASTTTIELSYDPLCMGIVLRMTDELVKHPAELYRCLGVRLSANGKGFDIDP